METKNSISVVIRVRNAAGDLERCLSSLESQVLPGGFRLDVVVVDNESTDESRQVALRHGARLVDLPRNDFTWGLALNRGIEKTKGEIVLLLSADAYAANAEFVAEMICPFDEDNVAAVYGRQLSRPDAPIDEIVRLKNTFGEETIRFDQAEDARDPLGRRMIVSNACAAIRKEIWRLCPYDEAIEGAEDRLWTQEVLRMGYSYVYQSSARVFHSHRDSLLRSACRQVELLRKDCRLSGRRIGIGQVVRWLARFSQCRLRNCASPGIRFQQRAEGFLRWPLEMTAFVFVSLLMDSRLAKHIRPILWR